MRVSISWTLRAVDAETRSLRPFREIAMWSARLPSTGTRQTILSVFRSNATTSANDGRETYRKRPSGEVKESSTYWW